MKFLHAVTITALLIAGGCASSQYSSIPEDSIYAPAGSQRQANPQRAAENNSEAQALYEKSRTVISKSSSANSQVVAEKSNAATVRALDNEQAGTNNYTYVNLDGDDDSYARRLRMFDQTEYTRPSSGVNIYVSANWAWGYPYYNYPYYGYYNPWWNPYRYCCGWYDPWYSPWYGSYYAWTPYYYRPYGPYGPYHPYGPYGPYVPYRPYYADHYGRQPQSPIGARPSYSEQRRSPQMQQVSGNRNQSSHYGQNMGRSSGQDLRRSHNNGSITNNGNTYNYNNRRRTNTDNTGAGTGNKPQYTRINPETNNGNYNYNNTRRGGNQAGHSNNVTIGSGGTNKSNSGSNNNEPSYQSRRPRNNDNNSNNNSNNNTNNHSNHSYNSSNSNASSSGGYSGGSGSSSGGSGGSRRR